MMNSKFKLVVQVHIDFVKVSQMSELQLGKRNLWIRRSGIGDHWSHDGALEYFVSEITWISIFFWIVHYIFLSWFGLRYAEL